MPCCRVSAGCDALLETGLRCQALRLLSAYVTSGQGRPSAIYGKTSIEGSETRINMSILQIILPISFMVTSSTLCYLRARHLSIQVPVVLARLERRAIVLDFAKFRNSAILGRL